MNELKDSPGIADVPEPTPHSDNGIPVDESAADVRGRIIKILSQKKLGPTEKNTAIADAVTRCLQRRGQFYFHAEQRDFDTAMFFDKTDKVLGLVRSDRFRSWLSLWTATNRADSLFRFIITEVENVALSPTHSSPIIPAKYWASRDEAIYLSCGDGLLVKITARGIKLADNGTDDVLFPCGGTLAPWELVAPVDPFESCAVFRDMACTSQHGKEMVRLFMLSLPTNPECKPPLVASGEIGSGKTRAGRAISELYGIPERVTKVEEKGETDFWVAMDRGGLLILDNADTKVKWLPDAIAAASTYSGQENRKLYTNSDTVMLRPKSWLMITSANPTFANDAGLADRLLLVRMNRREGETDDAKLSQEIRAARDSGLSYVAQTLSKALADKGETIAINSRHPDFGRFAIRIGRAIGREAETIAALRATENDKARFCLENDSIGAVLLVTIAQEPFAGTAAGLLERLKKLDPDLHECSVKRLSKKLASHWPHIKAVFRATKQVVHGGALEYQLRAKE